MSEHTNGRPHPVNSRVDATSEGPNELATLDLGDLARAIEMVKSSEIGAEPLYVLLRSELDRVKERVDALLLRLNRSALELRRLRESVPEAVVRNDEERRDLQEQNDRFVARLVEEHTSVLDAMRKERDAAIQRVRELSRELTRSGVNSCAPLSGPPQGHGAVSTTNQPSPSNHIASHPEMGSVGGQSSVDRGGADHELEEVTRANPKFGATDLAGTSGDGR
jgi:hypothetical protein